MGEAGIGGLLVQGGAAGTLLAVAWLLYIGKLRTSRELDEIREEHRRQLEAEQQETEAWRQAHAVSEAGRELAGHQAADLLDKLQLLVGFINALYAKAFGQTTGIEIDDRRRGDSERRHEDS